MVLLRFLLFSFVCIAFSLLDAEAYANTRICKNYYFSGGHSVDLTQNEKTLICGDETTEAWKEIPIQQVKKMLSVFLESRGYYRFNTHNVHGEIHFELEDPVLVQSIKVVPKIESFDIEEKRKIIGEPLTPSLLDELERWTKLWFTERGYACVEVTTKANSKTGEVLLSVDKNELFVFPEMKWPSQDWDTETLSRFQAFEAGDSFNQKELNITENRVLQKGVVQNLYFDIQCKNKQLTVKPQVQLGEPRLLKFGLGVDTERLITFKSSWQNVRLGTQGSFFSIEGLAAFTEQQITLRYQGYSKGLPQKMYVEPSVTFTHENEKHYQVYSFDTGVVLAQNIDLKNANFFYSAGPFWKKERTLRGVAPDRANILSFEASLILQSHDFEYYLANPQKGYYLGLDLDLTEDSSLSEVDAKKISLLGHYLINFSEFSPPLWILGFSTRFSTTLTSENRNRAALPTQYKQYLGGIASLRGFSSQELPTNGQGGLTSFFVSTELRYGDFIDHLDPFVFVDYGMIGTNMMSLLNSERYWSPGFGLRWDSPIGVMRGSLAHGYVIDVPQSASSHWQFHFNFGAEF